MPDPTPPDADAPKPEDAPAQSDAPEGETGSSGSEPGQPPAAGAEGAAPASPYRSMWAPLVVVPALIVIVPLLIVVLFGGIGGSRKSPEDYLRTIESGGANERQQALFGLTRQMLEWVNLTEEEQLEDPRFDPALLMPDLEVAWERMRGDEPQVRFVLAAMFALLDHPEGVERLSEILTLADSDDPKGELRYQALYLLGSTGDPRAVEAMQPLAEHEDPGLRAYAVIGMQKMPIELVRDTLVVALDDPDILVRGNAAVSMARLGDPAGASVLRALLDLDTYETERQQNPRRFQGQALVGQTRLAALEALALLRRDEDRELVRALAADEPDLNLRSEAKRIEQDWDLPPEARN